jgi:hypothetical protein
LAKNPFLFDPNAVPEPGAASCAKIWLVLAERVASPVQICKILEVPINDVAYHVDVLRKAGLIELVEEIPRRGAIEHRWRAIERPDFGPADIAAWSEAEKLANATSICQMAFADIVRALDGKTFASRDDHWVARLAGRVDEAGYEEVSAGCAELLETFYRAEERTKNRVASGETPTTMSVSGLAAFFEVPDRVTE